VSRGFQAMEVPFVCLLESVGAVVVASQSIRHRLTAHLHLTCQRLSDLSPCFAACGRVRGHACRRIMVACWPHL
jgi:hypothetical protein